MVGGENKAVCMLRALHKKQAPNKQEQQRNTPCNTHNEKRHVRLGEDALVEVLDELVDARDGGRELDRDAAADVAHAHVDGSCGRRGGGGGGRGGRHDLDRERRVQLQRRHEHHRLDGRRHSLFTAYNRKKMDTVEADEGELACGGRRYTAKDKQERQRPALACVCCCLRWTCSRGSLACW